MTSSIPFPFVVWSYQNAHIESEDRRETFLIFHALRFSPPNAV